MDSVTPALLRAFLEIRPLLGFRFLFRAFEPKLSAVGYQSHQRRLPNVLYFSPALPRQEITEPINLPNCYRTAVTKLQQIAEGTRRNAAEIHSSKTRIRKMYLVLENAIHRSSNLSRLTATFLPPIRSPWRSNRAVENQISDRHFHEMLHFF